MKLNKRAVALLISLVVLLTAVAGATAAYLIDRTPSIDNTFTPSRVACEVVQADVNKLEYTVQNTGDTDAYIRVAIAVNWKKDGSLYAKAPAFTVLGDGWALGSDGYYYYIAAVKPTDKTESALTVAVTEELDGYELFVEVVASAIQATSDAVEDWSNQVALIGMDGMLNVKAAP